MDAEHEVDGVFQQRFSSRTSGPVIPRYPAFRKSDTKCADGQPEIRSCICDHVRPVGADATSTEAVIADWKRLVDEMGVASESNYLWHKGRPSLRYGALASRPARKQLRHALISL